jgi:hypothetical protein
VELADVGELLAAPPIGGDAFQVGGQACQRWKIIDRNDFPTLCVSCSNQRRPMTPGPRS